MTPLSLIALLLFVCMPPVQSMTACTLPINNSSDFATIQELINMANPGEAIFLEARLYYECILVNKSIGLIGVGSAETVIDGQQLGTVIRIVVDNVTIRGLTIRNSGTLGMMGGILISNCRNVTVAENLISDCGYGVNVENSENIIIERNNLTSNFGSGVTIHQTSNSIIDKNEVKRHTPYGICLSYSEKNTVTENVISYICDGIYAAYSNHNNISLNLISNNSPHGVYLNSSNDNVITQNVITNNNFGMSLTGSSGNLLRENIVSHQKRYGIYLLRSQRNILRENNLTDNRHNFGVHGDDVSHFVNDIDTSNIIDGKPIYYVTNRHNLKIPKNASYIAIVNSRNITINDLTLGYNWQGIILINASSVTIRNVSVSDNLCEGIYLLQSHGNVIIKSKIEHNYYGVWLKNSSDNMFYHNNFINNKKHVECGPLSNNFWDNGYPSGGNYWSDNAGVDLFSGPDGIGDTPYDVDEKNQDNYPLMAMFSDFNATSKFDVQTICNSTISGFQFNGTTIIFNVSGEEETFGFCRICIPNTLLEPPYTVLVNNEPPLYDTTVFDNGTHIWIYFTYEHSTKEVTIIPEFPLVLILLLLITFTFVTVMFSENKRRFVNKQQFT